MIVVGITGASGVIYGVRLLEALNELNIENSLVISDAAKTVINHELERNVEDVMGPQSSFLLPDGKRKWNPGSCFSKTRIS